MKNLILFWKNGINFEKIGINLEKIAIHLEKIRINLKKIGISLEILESILTKFGIHLVTDVTVAYIKTAIKINSVSQVKQSKVANWRKSV